MPTSGIMAGSQIRQRRVESMSAAPEDVCIVALPQLRYSDKK